MLKNRQYYIVQTILVRYLPVSAVLPVGTYIAVLGEAEEFLQIEKFLFNKIKRYIGTYLPILGGESPLKKLYGTALIGRKVGRYGR